MKRRIKDLEPKENFDSEFLKELENEFLAMKYSAELFATFPLGFKKPSEAGWVLYIEYGMSFFDKISLDLTDNKTKVRVKSRHDIANNHVIYVGLENPDAIEKCIQAVTKLETIFQPKEL